MMENEEIPEFIIPIKPSDLEEPPTDNRFWIHEGRTNYSHLGEEELNTQIENLYNSLTSTPSAPLNILSDPDPPFFVLYNFMSSLTSLNSSIRKELAILLSQIMKSLAEIIHTVIRRNEEGGVPPRHSHQTPGPNIMPDAYKAHRSSLKATIFLATWFLDDFEKVTTQELNAQHSANAKLLKKKKIVSRKKVQVEVMNEDFGGVVVDFLEFLHECVVIDVDFIWRRDMEETYIQLVAKSCFDALERTHLIKEGRTKEGIFEVLRVILARYGEKSQNLYISTTTKLTNLFFSQENIAEEISELVVYIHRRSESSRLADEIIKEITKALTKHDTQHENLGVRNIALFLELVSEKLPKVVLNNIQKLIELFSCDAYQLRNGLMLAIGNIIIEMLSGLDEIDDQETRQHYTQMKNMLLDLLFVRIQDKTSFSRAKLLTIFQKLICRNALGKGRCEELLRISSIHLQDVSANVRRRAIQVVSQLMLVFGAFFQTSTFMLMEEVEFDYSEAKSALNGAQTKLESLTRGTVQKVEKVEEDPPREEGSSVIAQEAEEQGAKKEEGVKKREKKEEREMEDEGEGEEGDMGTDADADVDAEPQVVEGANLEQLKRREVEVVHERGGKLTEEERERAIIEAKNEVGHWEGFLMYYTDYIAFLKRVESLIPTCVQLLGSKNQSDILESIKLFTRLKQKRIEGAEKGIRKMLILLYTKEENIKSAVMEAYEDLYLNANVAGDVKSQYLISLVQNASLNELACLEEFIRMAMSMPKSLLENTVFKHLWGIFLRNPLAEAEKASGNVEEGGMTEEGKAKFAMDISKENMAAIQLITYATSVKPEIISKNTELLMRQALKLGKQRYPDLMLFRACLVALEKVGTQADQGFLRESISLMLKTGRMDTTWFTCMEQLINTILTTTTDPEEYFHYLLTKLSKPLFAGGLRGREDAEGECEGSSIPTESLSEHITPFQLSQIVFTAGHISLKMLVHIEQLESNIRAKYTEGDGNVGNNGNNGNNGNGNNNSPEDEDELEKMGGGREAELENEIALLRGISERGLLGKESLIGRYVPIVQKLAKAAYTRGRGESSLVGGTLDLTEILPLPLGGDLNTTTHTQTQGDISLLSQMLADSTATVRGSMSTGAARIIDSAESLELGRSADARLRADHGGDGHVDMDTSPPIIPLPSLFPANSTPPHHIPANIYDIIQANHKLKFANPHQYLMDKCAILSLCKMMYCSVSFCKDNLRLLFGLVGAHHIEATIKANIIISIGDLFNRFPNIMNEWRRNLFETLQDTHPLVRKNALMVLSHLILGQMIKLRGEICDICMLLEDEEDNIRNFVQLFLFEYNQRGQNNIYNLFLKAIGRLSVDYSHITQERFENVAKNLLKYIEKEKQIDQLIEKLCHRLKTTQSFIEIRNCAFCLTQFSYSERNLKKLVENYHAWKDRINTPQVMERFKEILVKVKRQARAETKSLVQDFENKVLNHGSLPQGVDREILTQGTGSKRRKAGAAKRGRGTTSHGRKKRGNANANTEEMSVIIEEDEEQEISKMDDIQEIHEIHSRSEISHEEID